MLKLNLGIPQLLPEWRNIFSGKFLGNDLIAGTTVAFVSIPLSLAIALASGVAPATGLVTAIIAGIICAFFGGSAMAVSGPAAAMSVLLATTVESYGASGLVTICLLAGMMQLLSGVAGIGRLGKFVPLPVIAGFTAGIGVIIIIGQLPRAFGLTPPPESHIISVLNHIYDYMHEINGTCLLLVFTTIAIIRTLPKIFPRIPPILPAVIFVSLITFLFKLDVPLIGEIPRHLPSPKVPEFGAFPIKDLLITAFSVYLLASLETLLSCNAVDKISGGKKHDPDQELIGQGLGNIAVSFFSGMPVTSVIARSATNVRAGAKTRRSSIIQALIVLLAVLAIAPVISLIPIAALAGVLFNVAYSMIEYREFKLLWKISRSEALIYATTFFTIISVDLIAGVQAGMAAAAIIVLVNATKTHLLISPSSQDGITRLTLTGNLGFLSLGKINILENTIKKLKKDSTIILDLTHITDLDSSAAAAVIDLFCTCQELNLKFYIKGLQRKFEPLFSAQNGQKILDEFYITSEQELKSKSIFGSEQSSHGRLVHGVKHFYYQHQLNDKRLFEQIAQQQNPHTLFITCSDSRIIPSLITSSDPGELFIMRNIGNAIPPYSDHATSSEAAAIQFALSSFAITDIVICGHAKCGALNACLGDMQKLPPNLHHWIGMIKSGLANHIQSVDEASQLNVLNQINNLKQYPIVQEKLRNNQLTIHGWFFDIDRSIVYEWDNQKETFDSLVTEKSV